MGQVVDKTLLPEGLADWVEDVAQGKLTDIRPHAGVGVSREGCFVQVQQGGKARDFYLAYDVRRADDVSRQDFIRREYAALSIAVENGIRAPRPVARWPERRAILTQTLQGDVGTEQLSDAVKVKLARDYIGDIAKLHRLDIKKLGDLEGFGEPVEPQQYIRKRIAYFRGRHHAYGRDNPFMALVYKWLEKNIPRESLPVSIVHGDVGPGNFLHKDHRITGVLDWEQTHFGDPIEDFGWLITRLALFPFSPIKPFVEAYQKAGGYTVDPVRVRYYRVMCHASSMTDMCAQLVQSDSKFAGNLGHVFKYYFALQKLTADSLVEAESLKVEPIKLHKTNKAAWERLFQLAVDELEVNIGPRSSDQVGKHRSQSMVSLVKYWQGRAVYGEYADSVELKDIEAVLGTSFSSLDEARVRFAEAIETDGIPLLKAMQVLIDSIYRNIQISREALGHLAECQYPPL